MNMFLNLKLNHIETILGELVGINFAELPELKRLKSIRFQGAMTVKKAPASLHSRYDHSVSVAYLGYLVSTKLGFSKKDTIIVVTAALLHDIGHTPFSHIAEPILRRKLKRFHQGQSSLMIRRILDITSDNNIYYYFNKVDVSYSSDIFNLIIDNGQKNHLHHLMHGPFSIDSLDGIWRVAISMNLYYVPDLEKIINNLFWKSGKLGFAPAVLEDLERFWELRTYIYDELVSSYESISASAMIYRALQETFHSKDDLRKFLTLTDQNVQAEFLKYPIPRKIMSMLQNRILFKSLLSNNESSEIWKYYHRLNKPLGEAEILKIEKSLSNTLRIHFQYIIIYYFIKNEFSDKILKNQPKLFDIKYDNYDVIWFDDFEKIFRRKTKYGQLFDIFYPEINTIEKDLPFNSYLDPFEWW